MLKLGNITAGHPMRMQVFICREMVRNTLCQILPNATFIFMSVRAEFNDVNKH